MKKIITVIAILLSIAPNAFSDTHLGPYNPNQPHVSLPNNLFYKNTAGSVITPNISGQVPVSYKAAIYQACNIWAGQINSTQQIIIDFDYAPLGNGELAKTGMPFSKGSNLTPQPGSQAVIFNNVDYPRSLAEKLTQTYLSGSAIADFKITIQSDLSWTTSIYPQQLSWYTNTNSNPGQYELDLEELILHEIAHGLGYETHFTLDNSGQVNTLSTSNNQMTIFDFFLEDANGKAFPTVLTTTPAPDPAVDAYTTSGQIFWGGANGLAQNGGVPVQMYAPNPFVSGSSLDHTDPIAFPNGSANGLMSPDQSPNIANHIISPSTLGILDDIGWRYQATPVGGNVTISGPSSITLTSSPIYSYSYNNLKGSILSESWIMEVVDQFTGQYIQIGVAQWGGWFNSLPSSLPAGYTYKRLPNGDVYARVRLCAQFQYGSACDYLVVGIASPPEDIVADITQPSYCSTDVVVGFYAPGADRYEIFHWSPINPYPQVISVRGDISNVTLTGIVPNQPNYIFINAYNAQGTTSSQLDPYYPELQLENCDINANPPHGGGSGGNGGTGGVANLDKTTVFRSIDKLIIAHAGSDVLVSIGIYDMLGQRIVSTDMTLHTGNRDIDISTLSSGMYVAKLTERGTGASICTTKFTIVK